MLILVFVVFDIALQQPLAAHVIALVAAAWIAGSIWRAGAAQAS